VPRGKKLALSDSATDGPKEYLQPQAFSRGGLIEQLEYEGFTPTQAA
jgi:hypothetical protein